MNNSKEEYQSIKIRAWAAIKECTCQFLVKGYKKYEGYGSGVFVKIDNHCFLISAAHVLEEKPLDLHVPLEQNGTILGGQINTNKINGKRSDDKLDVGVFKLDKRTVDSLSNYYEFLDSSLLGVNHQLEIKDRYLTFGYPTSKTVGKYNTNKVESYPYGFVTWPKAPDIYSVLDCKLNENIIIHFDKKGFVNPQGETVVAPNTYGMSGSGLWYVPDQSTDDSRPIQIKLVGILTEWYSENRKCIITTRIDVISELIRQVYNLNLPVSEIYKTTINLEEK